MLLTRRDLALMDRLARGHVLTEDALADLFPSTAVLRRRLGVLTRHGYVLIRNGGSTRGYTLGPSGMEILRGGRSRASLQRLLLYGRVKDELESEGYRVVSERQSGSVRIMDAAGPQGDAIVIVCDPGAPVMSARNVIKRAVRLINPFRPRCPRLIIYTRFSDPSLLAGVQPSFRRYISLRPFPKT
jgi:hypothetical protein